MTSLGLNAYINAQGFARIGMMTTLIGAVLNIILDPVFIFIFDMGVQGAAIATVISQAASAAWTFRFLTGNGTILRIRLSSMKPHGKTIGQITSLAVRLHDVHHQQHCPGGLQLHPLRLRRRPLRGRHDRGELHPRDRDHARNRRHNGSQPVISFNYGAGKYDRIKKAIRFMSISCIVYTVAIWGILHLFPVFFIHIFNNQPDLVEAAVPSMQIYYFGFFMMSLQFSGQTVFQALGKAKFAIFFSILRKVVIVTPLTLLLPRVVTPAVNGVFLAEPSPTSSAARPASLPCWLWSAESWAACRKRRKKQPEKSFIPCFSETHSRTRLTLTFVSPAIFSMEEPSAKRGKRHFPFCF